MPRTPAKDRPSTPHPEYVAAAPDVLLIRDLLAGTRTMQANRELYIPKYEREQAKAYKRRATAAKVYGGLGRTLSASVGMLFAKPPHRSDNWPAAITQQAENIDLAGALFEVFVKRAAEDAIADGFSVVLVDHPQPPASVTVHAGNEAALNLRPKWARYSRADVISWRVAVIGNALIPTQVVFRETADVPDGAFGTKTVTRYRQCQLGLQAPNADGIHEFGATWRLLEEREDGPNHKTFVQIEVGAFRDRAGALFPQIPIAICYAGRTDAPFCARPPLLDVAWANLEHWRTATNLEYYSALACFPQPTLKGEMAKDAAGVPLPFALGPGVMVQVTKDSEFGWTEIDGRSLAELRAQLADRKDEIGELGASFLARKTQGVETAEAKRLDATAENASLATAAQGLQDGINEALRLHARYLGIADAEAPTVTINTDFDAITMDAQAMAAYVGAVQNAGLPPRILLEAWQAGGRIGPDEDLEALEAEMMADAQAQAEQKAAELAVAKQPPPPAVPVGP